MNENIVITETPSLTGATISETISANGSLRSSNTSSATSSSSSVSSSGWNFGKIIRYVLIIAILIFLGLNLFAYLGKKNGGVTNILGTIGKDIGDTLKQTVDTSAKGTKGIVDIGAKAVDSGVNLLEKGIDSKNGKKKRNKIDDKRKGTGLALEDAVSKSKTKSSEPVPDEAGSRTQSNKAVGKSGYCYIGEDRGFRSCIKVNESDMCMSGDIFPTRAICINPNLRE